MTYKIYKILRDNANEFYSGQTLAEHFGVSRASINKHITKLKTSGIEILSNTNSGYKLCQKCDLLNEYTIKYALSKYGLKMDVKYFDNIPSTNNVCKTVDFDKTHMLFVANTQDFGKGRRDRGFISKSGGAYFSYLAYFSSMNITDVLKCVLLSGVAVVSALKEIGINAKLKYPNDVMVNDKKICGILCETVSSFDIIERLIIGIGININNPIDGDISNIATSVFNETGIVYDRAEIIVKTINNLVKYLDTAKTDGFREVMRIYKNYSNTLNAEVKVIENNGDSYTGKAIDLDDDGFLIVQSKTGNKRVIASDVSIRKA